MNRRYLSVALLTVSILYAIGCDTPKAPILPTTPLTPEQIEKIRSEDEKIAFEESQGSMTAANNSSN